MARFSYHPRPSFAIACGLFFTVAAGLAAADNLAARRQHGDQLHGIYPDKEHAVVKGDTLWDLSATYLHDPWIWPDIWQVNPQIGHPDLIYPGNRLNLPGYSKTPQVAQPRHAAAPGSPATRTGETAAATPAPEAVAPEPKVVVPSNVVSRTAWIVAAGKDVGLATIIGSWHHNRTVLATDAAVHVSLGARDGVVAGDHFRIVNTERVIHHPRTGALVGRVAKVVGELEITAVRDTTATGRVIQANAPIQVGDVLLADAETAPVTEPGEPPAERDLHATILAASEDQFALAERAVIFLDVGQSQSVQPGDRFLLDGTDASAVDDSPRYVAEAVVLATQPTTCTALIMHSLTETYVGGGATYTTASLPDIYHQ